VIVVYFLDHPVQYITRIRLALSVFIGLTTVREITGRIA